MHGQPLTSSSNSSAMRSYRWYDPDTAFTAEVYACDTVCSGLLELAAPWNGVGGVTIIDGVTPPPRVRCCFCRQPLT
jgi:hypothetical protein